MSRYLMSQNFVERVKATVLKVDGMPQGGGPHKIQTRFEDGPSGGGGGRLRIGKTTATWTKGTTATIPLWEEGTPPNETASNSSLEGCVNKWADVAGNKWVGIQRAANGTYYLVVAEC